MDKLKPCPFCGGEAVLIEDKDTQGTLYQIRCNNPDCWIGAYTSFYSDKSTTITAWNTRTPKERGGEK